MYRRQTPFSIFTPACICMYVRSIRHVQHGGRAGNASPFLTRWRALRHLHTPNPGVSRQNVNVETYSVVGLKKRPLESEKKTDTYVVLPSRTKNETAQRSWTAAATSSHSMECVAVTDVFVRCRGLERRGGGFNQFFNGSVRKLSVFFSGGGILDLQTHARTHTGDKPLPAFPFQISDFQLTSSACALVRAGLWSSTPSSDQATITACKKHRQQAPSQDATTNHRIKQAHPLSVEGRGPLLLPTKNSRQHKRTDTAHKAGEDYSNRIPGSRPGPQALILGERGTTPPQST